MEGEMLVSQPVVLLPCLLQSRPNVSLFNIVTKRQPQS